MEPLGSGEQKAAQQYLERIEALLPSVAAAAAEIEAARQLPATVVELLRAARVFAAAVPESWGGLELDPMTQARGIELLSGADASVGWCAMIGSDTGYMSAFLDDAVGRRVFTDPTSATATVLNPTGVASPAADGYSVTGRWTFASGSTHARVYALACRVMTDSRPRMVTVEVPEIRVAVIPAEQAEVIDTWTTTGVRGSGSHDVHVRETFVPEEHTFSLFPAKTRRAGPLYALPTMYLAKTGAVGLGIARGAIDDVVTMATSKRTLGNPAPIAEQAWLHAAVAGAETKLGQARAFYYEILGDVWRSLLAGEIPPLRTRAMLHLSIVGTAEQGLSVVDAMYRAGGSAALYARGTLDRRLRDMHTIAQHVVFSPAMVSDCGKAMLGLPVPNSRFLQG